MSRPVFVCVPTLYHSPAYYEPLKANLLFHGYIVIPVPLPSVGGNPPTYDFTEDIQSIRDRCTELSDSGKDIILLMHGYGSIAGGEALQGLGKPEREQRGLKGGVIRSIFIMSMLVREGYQGSQRGDISSMYPWSRSDVPAGITTVKSQEDGRSIFYNDLPPAAATYWASQLLPQSIGVLWSKTTFSAWRCIPSTYVLCGRDQVIPLPYAEMILKAAQETKPNMIDSVERCMEAGHCPMLGQTEWTANMLRRAAGESL